MELRWGRAAWGSAQAGILWRALEVIPRAVRATLRAGVLPALRVPWPVALGIPEVLQ